MTASGALQNMEHLAEVELSGRPLGAARAIRLLQARAALGVLRALLPGPQRFSAIQRASGARSATTLQLRLSELQAAGVVEHRGLRYQLSPSGQRLDALMTALDQFHAAYPQLDPAALLSALQRRAAMPIMRALIPGELGFNELQRAAQVPSATTLSQRLADLAQLGLIVRTVPPGHPARVLYRHSALGAAFNTVIGHIVLWGEGLSPALIAALLEREAAQAAPTTVAPTSVAPALP